MRNYVHHVSGFFVQRHEANLAYDKLIGKGLQATQLRIFSKDDLAPTDIPHAQSNVMLKRLVVDGAVGTAVGTGLGALAEFALVAANVTLFVASPLIAPLVMLGWGASLGAVVGAVAGATRAAPNKADGKFSELVEDAILQGQVVLVAYTHSTKETALAAKEIQGAVGEYKDLAVV